MEVEVKLRLPDAGAHQKVAELLAPFRKTIYMQENLFFDGGNNELSSRRVVLRLRFYDDDSRCVMTLKGQALIQNGVSRAEEIEEEIDPTVGRAYAAEPWRLKDLKETSNIISRILQDYGCEKGFISLGGFRNVRGVFDWSGLTIELDETHFEFGTQYEIECETDDPEGVKARLEAFLRENGVSFSDSLKSKFAIFRSGKLPD